jgi:hypothetical protein
MFADSETTLDGVSVQALATHGTALLTEIGGLTTVMVRHLAA